MIPANRLSPAGEAYLTQLPTPNLTNLCGQYDWTSQVGIPLNWREENVRGGIATAIDKMDWRPYAKKVIVLVADTPPSKDDFAATREMIAGFRARNGTFTITRAHATAPLLSPGRRSNGAMLLSGRGGRAA